MIPKTMMIMINVVDLTLHNIPMITHSLTGTHTQTHTNRHTQTDTQTYTHKQTHVCVMVNTTFNVHDCNIEVRLEKPYPDVFDTFENVSKVIVSKSIIIIIILPSLLCFVIFKRELFLNC